MECVRVQTHHNNCFFERTIIGDLSFVKKTLKHLFPITHTKVSHESELFGHASFVSSLFLIHPNTIPSHASIHTRQLLYNRSNPLQEFLQKTKSSTSSSFKATTITTTSQQNSSVACPFSSFGALFVHSECCFTILQHKSFFLVFCSQMDAIQPHE